MSRCGIGTVQFGKPYGKFNTTGIPSSGVVETILTTARRLGLTVVDTARDYGESEQRLGECSALLQDFDVITKTPTFGTDVITSADAARLRDSFEFSLRLLRLPSVGGLLVHHAPDLLAPGGDRLYHELVRLKDEGRVRRIGISAYTGEIAERVAEMFAIDMVQLPINVFDQRLVQTGSLSRLGQHLEIHARSAFLQGLALADPERLPKGLDGARGSVTAFQGAARAAGITPAQAALQYLMGLDDVRRIIVGVDTAEQLTSIFEGFPPELIPMDHRSFSIDDETVLNPALWPR